MKRAGISIWKDHEAASLAAAHYFVFCCLEAVSRSGKFIVALSGGNTPRRFYELLGTGTFSRNIPWDKVFIFWSDERFVALTDADSNYRMAREALLDHIPVRAGNIFPVPIKEKAKGSATSYEKMLSSFFEDRKPVFDCIFLGTGNDGHTASLMPGTEILHEKKKWIGQVWAGDQKGWRISFTISLINQAKNIVFLATGNDKSAILQRILGKKEKPALPAQLIEPRKGNLLWILDEAAAAKI